MKDVSFFKLLAAFLSSIVVFIVARLHVVSVPPLCYIVPTSIGLIAYVIISTILLGQIGPLVVRKNLERAGLTNHIGDPPVLLWSKSSDNIPNGITLEFMNFGVPREDFEAKKAEIEAALNIYIIWISDKNRRHTIIDAVPATRGLPAFIPWHDRYLIKDGISVCLGIGLCGPVNFRWDISPHMIVGGASGSGKSVIARSVIYQCLRNGFTVQCIDFKGGLDYIHFRHARFHLLTTPEACLSALKGYTEEISRREDMFRKAGVTNLDEYNAQNKIHQHSRILLAIDEVAEVLDKTGHTKEEKELIDKITGCLMTIARIGRASGVHLLLSQQRPDANVLPGQIKNNCTLKICGRADLTLSQIILDKGDAHDKIPKNSRGLFLVSGSESPELSLFRGFYFDPASLSPDEWDSIGPYIAEVSLEEE